MWNEEADFQALCEIFGTEFKGTFEDSYNNAVTTRVLGTSVQYGHNFERNHQPEWTLINLTEEFIQKAKELGITLTNWKDGYGTMYL